MTERDVAAAAGVLARAFSDNTAMCAVLRGDPPDTRLRLLERAMRGFAEAVRRHGLAEVAKMHGQIAGISLVFPPGAYPPAMPARLLIASGPVMAGPRRALRFARLDAQLHKRQPRDPHWYLWMIGVEPRWQGHGLGSALVRSLSARADRSQTPCCLETDVGDNVRLYERHGYRVLSDEVLPVLGTRHWFMRRDIGHDS